MKTANSSDRNKKTLILNYWPYELQLKHVFTIASGSRTTTPVVLTSIEYEGIKGFGEASMPPYLGESHKSVMDFLSGVDLSEFNDPLSLGEILEYVNGLSPGNYAAKASVDIALHDLAGKLKNEPCYEMFGLDPLKTPLTSLTIGIDKPDIVRQKVKEAENFRVLKIKVCEGNEKEMVNSVRSLTDKPLFVDVNRGWSDKYYALDMASWLSERNVCFIEQPFPETRIDDIAWLTQNSPLPIIADEGIKTLEDLNKWNGLYSGVNIKLMKCGGMEQAFKMIRIARSMNMKVMIGCMTETSCAVSAAAQLSPAADWADLDGNILITNDIYDGMIVVDGKISLNDRPGIGIVEKS
jgi:L-alanine-DL-glutamate epimerase-like enolase superfamily enzyme